MKTKKLYLISLMLSISLFYLGTASAVERPAHPMFQGTSMIYQLDIQSMLPFSDALLAEISKEFENISLQKTNEVFHDPSELIVSIAMEDLIAEEITGEFISEEDGTYLASGCSCDCDHDHEDHDEECGVCGDHDHDHDECCCCCCCCEEEAYGGGGGGGGFGGGGSGFVGSGGFGGGGGGSSGGDSGEGDSGGATTTGTDDSGPSVIVPEPSTYYTLSVILLAVYFLQKRRVAARKRK